MARQRAVPETMLLLYLVFLAVQIPVGFGRLAISDLFLGLFLLLSGGLRYPRKAVNLWVFPLLALFPLGLLVAAVHNGTLSSNALLNKGLGMGVLVTTYLSFISVLSSWEEVSKYVRVFVYSTVWVNCLALVEFVCSRLGLFDITWLNYGRARLAGPLLDPNAYGGLLLVAFILQQASGGSPWAAFVDVSLILGLILTFSRSAWVGLALAVLALLVLKPKQGLKVVLLVLAAVILGLVVVNWQSMLDMSLRANQVTARINIAENALAEFYKSPIFGIGLGTYHSKHGVIIHNTLLWILVEFGLIGLTIFTSFIGWFILAAVSRLRSANTQHRPLVAVTLVAFVAVLGLSVGIEALYQRYWWFIMAVISALWSLPGGTEPVNR